MRTSAKIKIPASAQETLNDLIIDSIQDIKGKNIVRLDLRHLQDAPADYFIICEGDSNTQVKAMSENVHRRIKDELHLNPGHVEGQGHSRWICMDYFDTVVHIFYRETRPYYDLEQLWGDARFTEYENL